jgi:hypothetical protein
MSERDTKESPGQALLRRQIPRGIYARKPPHGSPCNGCGVCCMVTLCPLGQHIFGFELGRCPALTKRARPGEIRADQGDDEGCRGVAPRSVAADRFRRRL